MCQAIADGGRRCPRHRRDSIVAMQFAASEANLPLEVVNDLFTELRREARHMDTHGLEDSHEQFIATLQEQAEANGVDQRYRDILSAHSEDPAPAPDTLYALTRLRRRAIDRSLNLSSALGTIARQNAVSVSEVTERFNQTRSELDQDNSAVDAPEYTEESRAAAYTQDLPYDANTVVALQRTREGFDTYGERGEPRITDYATSSRLDSLLVGYDPDGGRLEITSMPAGNTDLNLTYRNVPQEEYDAWEREGFSLRSPVYVDRILGNDSYRYDTPEDAERDRYTYRCSACGQFAAAAHECAHREAIDQLMAESPGRTRDSITSAEVETRVAENNPVEDPTPSIEVQERVSTVEQTLQIQLGRTLPRNESTGVGMRPADPDTTISFTAEEVQELRNNGVYRLFPASAAEIMQSLGREERSDRLAPRVFGALTREQIASLPPDRLILSQSTFEWTEDEYGNSGHRRNIHVAGDFDGTTHILPGNQNSLYFGPYSARGEGAEFSLHRRGITNPGYESREAYTEQRDADSVEFRNEHGQNLHSVNPVTTWNRTYEFRVGVESKIMWAGKRDFRRGINEGKVVSSSILWEENSSRLAAEIDEFGYDIENKGFAVSGQLAMKKNDDGTYSVVSPKTSLRCTCGVYARNYHCTHIDYVHNHAPKMGHQMEAPSAGAANGRTQGMPLNVSNHRDVDISRDDENDRVSVGFTSSPHLQYRGRTAPLSEAAPEVDDLLTQHRIQGLTSARFYAPPATVLATAVRNADNVRVPFRFERAYDYSTSQSYWSSTYSLSGQAVYTRGEDGEMALSTEQMRCSCGRFTAESGTCPHIELLNEHSDYLLHLTDRSTREQVESRVPRTPQTLTRGNSVLEVYMRLGAGEITDAQAREQMAEIEAEAARERAEHEERERARLAERVRQERQLRLQQASYMRELHAEFTESNPEYATYRAGQKELWEDADERYGDNTEAVKEVIRDAQSTQGDTDEYLTENVTDGVCDPSVPGSRRFGVELEFVLPNNVNHGEALAKIARELHEAGLSESSRMGGYHSGARSGWASWNLESDATVDGELVSPLMADTPEHWEQLEKAITILKNNGAKTSRRAGSHVHVSNGSFSGKLSKNIELLRTVKDHEDVLFRAAADPSTGTHRGTSWCAPNVSTETFGDVSVDEYEGRRAISSLRGHTSHRQMINVGAAIGMNSKAHVEYRMWDASLDAKTIQKQIAASVAITEAAERTVENNEGESKARTTEKTGAAYGNGAQHSGNTREVHETTLTNLTEFVDKVFRRKTDQERFIRLFASKKNAR